MLDHVPLARAAEMALDPTDEVLAARASTGDSMAFELLMRRNNRRVFRIVRSLLRDGDEIEDVMQDAYFSAFTHLHQFRGSARWSTWLCKIAFNEALARTRRRRVFVSLDTAMEGSIHDSLKAPNVDPERAAGDRQLALVLEEEIDRLPDIYRTAIVLRQMEGLDVAETAAVLGVEEDVVKTRLHRARALLRAAIEGRIGEQLDQTYSFGAERCDRVVAAVIARIGQRF